MSWSKARVIATFALLVLVGGAAGRMFLRPGCAALAGDGTLTIPLNGLARGAARFFCYRDDAGRRLRFILARDSMGEIHTVLDACTQCYSFHEGYKLSRGHLVCRLCGNRYQLKHMEAGTASCVPASLPHQRQGESVLIKTSELKRKGWLF